jgi:hypothetical protein
MEDLEARYRDLQRRAEELRAEATYLRSRMEAAGIGTPHSEAVCGKEACDPALFVGPHGLFPGNPVRKGGFGERPGVLGAANARDEKSAEWPAEAAPRIPRSPAADPLRRDLPRRLRSNRLGRCLAA